MDYRLCHTTCGGGVDRDAKITISEIRQDRNTAGILFWHQAEDGQLSVLLGF